ncbi:flagellar biosynthesis protein FlhB [Candidatus Paraluminiphilus aquimaris]|jgi:flagellar biosynthesis protein|uniref:Flagellar biosynthetic protein FlhB n=1 Tax=Candidatus Paraluminiphilus aquimaris TaxID=2518994 RepID=A0ABY6Q584_9GAMM|nr:EscU/YscU/HrcU family type III secretion system export apparatus switch protein [Candidatus Paraluminiphilus aquimaris]UZP73822.1 flagellar biosynthesis protein FlhB [Candidatus Paraluminiphilus aquimaris]
MKDSEFERAVALHYDQQGAPTVLATGEGEIARLIKERAEAAGVPLVEDPKLSYLLSKIPLGDEIPPELYRAVAEVLVFVLRLEKSLEVQV